jgi:hypothetical protein
MKITEITEIIETNPDAIFIDNHSGMEYRIEGITTSANGAKMVVIRQIWGRYEIDTDIVTSHTSKNTRTRQPNAVGCVKYSSESYMQVVIKNQYHAQQARLERVANQRKTIAALNPQLAAALKANGIEEMHTSRYCTDTDYKLTLSPQNAAKLLAILNAGAAQ